MFNKILFRENISRYGHEDTIFGIELERQGVSVIHLDNQLIHTGLDSADVFLEKTRDGLTNLAELLKSYDHPDDLTGHIRLLKQYVKFKKWGLSPLLNLIYKTSGKRIKRNLTGSKPSMRLLDLYKLCVLNKIQA